MSVLRRAAVTVSAVVLVATAARAAARRGGVTRSEAHAPLPGDEQIPASRVVATRAVTIDAPPEAVWPWLVQIGQDRGGFYSFDRLENLFGLDIHSADTIEPDWQDLRPDDVVRLAPTVALDVVAVDEGRSLVLRAPGSAFTWAFVLQPVARGTRLVARERYATHDAATRATAEVLTLVSAVMTHRMLRGIRDRATGTPSLV